MIVYMIVETMGAAAGYGILKGLTPCEFYNSGLCMTLPQQNVSTTQLFFIEFLLTFTLVLVVS
jgi:glycerol uptake facilitator-like aquaporin